MSSPIAWSDVTSLPGALNDGLGAVPVGGQTMILNFVNNKLDVNMFDGEDGFQTKLGRCLLAAHLAALSKLGTGGPLTQESAGGLMRAYAVPQVMATLDATSYGKAYRSVIGSQAYGPRLL